VKLLTDSAILTTAGFERGSDKFKVPSWRDGEAGRVLQINMARLLGERYFDYGCCKDNESGNTFRSGEVWSSFARMHPFILNCFKDQFGSDHANWAKEPMARWGEIMRGKYDAEIKTLSDSFPFKFANETAAIMAKA
jgi:hypothetical protein